MKKTLFFCAFVLMSLPVYAGSFPDVGEDHPNYEAVEYLDERGVINGYSDGTFKPDNLVNRAEATKIIVGGLNIALNEGASQIFSDVPSNEWFFPYVMGAHSVGVIEGYDDGLFRPADNVNLAELLKIVLVASDVSVPTEIAENVFSDVPNTVWYAGYAEYAKEHNVVLPDEYGYLHAEQEMTRAALSEVIYRMMVVMENQGQPYPLYLSWDLYQGKEIPFKISYDSNDWEVLENEKDVVFFRPDKQFMQFSEVRVYPNSAVVRITHDANEGGESKEQYFAKIREVFSDASFQEFEIGGLDALEVLYSDDRIVDWYIYLEDGTVLVAYTEFGNGSLGYLLTRYIQAMLSTLEYSPVPESVNYSDQLSTIFANVLIEGKGTEMLNLVPDEIIIETDTIGVGTGPLDYYYSDAMDYTFKYERASDVILDTREGRTTAF